MTISYMIPLLIGQHVTRKNSERRGRIAYRRLASRNPDEWAYMVRWDGNEHDSGEYSEGLLARWEPAP